MKTYITNKTIFEDNFIDYLDQQTQPFPLVGNFEFKQVYSLDDNYILFDCTYKESGDFCPNCNSYSTSVKEYDFVYPNVATLNNKTVITRITKRSLRCKNIECKRKTFMKNINEITKRKRVAKEVNRAIISDFKSISSFKSIAERHNVSTSQVIRLFDSLIIKRVSKVGVSNILVDETRLLNKYCKGSFQFFVYDADTHVLLEILEDRSYKSVHDYLSNFFNDGALDTFTMDMWAPYKQAMNAVDSNVDVIIDRFHYVRYIMNGFDNVRIKIMNKIKREKGTDSAEYNELKSKLNVKYLRMNPSKLKDERYQEIKKILEAYPTLYLAFEFKNDFLHSIKNISSGEVFKMFIESYLEEIDKINTDMFDDAISVFTNWKNEIANSFDYPYTNAYVEGTNQKVKVLKRNAYGLANLPRTKKRMMYAFGKRDILESSILKAI